jgi:hypothetical protein
LETAFVLPHANPVKKRSQQGVNRETGILSSNPGSYFITVKIASNCVPINENDKNNFVNYTNKRFQALLSSISELYFLHKVTYLMVTDKFGVSFAV